MGRFKNKNSKKKKSKNKNYYNTKRKNNRKSNRLNKLKKIYNTKRKNNRKSKRLNKFKNKKYGGKILDLVTLISKISEETGYKIEMMDDVVELPSGTKTVDEKRIGTFGEVYKINITDSEGITSVCALKLLRELKDIDDITHENLKLIKLDLISKLDNDNILKILKFGNLYFDPPVFKLNTSNGENENGGNEKLKYFGFTITDWCEDVSSLIKHRNTDNELYIHIKDNHKKILLDICMGVKRLLDGIRYRTSSGGNFTICFVHKDIKPENIGLMRKGDEIVACLMDLDDMFNMKTNFKYGIFEDDEFMGSRLTSAPETQHKLDVEDNNRIKPVKVDVYSCGETYKIMLDKLSTKTTMVNPLHLINGQYMYYHYMANFIPPANPTQDELYCVNQLYPYIWYMGVLMKDNVDLSLLIIYETLRKMTEPNKDYRYTIEQAIEGIELSFELDNAQDGFYSLNKDKRDKVIECLVSIANDIKLLSKKKEDDINKENRYKYYHHRDLNDYDDEEAIVAWCNDKINDTYEYIKRNVNEFTKKFIPILKEYIAFYDETNVSKIKDYCNHIKSEEYYDTESKDLVSRLLGLLPEPEEYQDTESKKQASRLLEPLAAEPEKEDDEDDEEAAF